MPIYEYRCDNGHVFEVMQRMTDDPVAVCQTCEASVQRVFHPVAVHFKGSGFYSTDYGSSNRAKETEAAASSSADKKDAKGSSDSKGKTEEATKAKDSSETPKKKSSSGSSD